MKKTYYYIVLVIAIIVVGIFISGVMNYATYAPKEVKKSKVLNNVAPSQPPTPAPIIPNPAADIPAAQ